MRWTRAGLAPNTASEYVRKRSATGHIEHRTFYLGVGEDPGLRCHPRSCSCVCGGGRMGRRHAGCRVQQREFLDFRWAASRLPSTRSANEQDLLPPRRAPRAGRWRARRCAIHCGRFWRSIGLRLPAPRRSPPGQRTRRWILTSCPCAATRPRSAARHCPGPAPAAATATTSLPCPACRWGC